MSDPKKKKKRKKARADSGHGRARSAPDPSRGRWFGQEVGHNPKDRSLSDTSGMSSSSHSSSEAKKKKAKKKKKKERRKVAKDRGPFGSGSKVVYGKSLEVSSGSSDNESVFRDGPASGNGTSLQLQLQEYALKCPGRLAARLLQRMQAMVGKEGGQGPGKRTPPGRW